MLRTSLGLRSFSILAAAAGLAAPDARAASSFQGIGVLEDRGRSSAWAVSDSGLVVVGEASLGDVGDVTPNQLAQIPAEAAARWTPADGLRTLYSPRVLGRCDDDRPSEPCTLRGGFESAAYAVSADGNTVAGFRKQQEYEWFPEFQEWVETFPSTPQFTGYYDWKPDQGWEQRSKGTTGSPNTVGLTADGEQILVTTSGEAGGVRAQANLGGTGALNGLAQGGGVLSNFDEYDSGLHSSYAIDVSADGDKALIRTDFAGDRVMLVEPYTETENFEFVNLGFFQTARALSADGEVVVGNAKPDFSTPEPVRWDSENGTELLDLSGVADATGTGDAFGVSGDGSRVVGRAVVDDPGGGASITAFLWDESTGTARTLADVLSNDYGLDVSGWELREARDISADGRTIVGNGRAPDGTFQGWVAFLGTEASEQAPLGPGDGQAASLLQGEPVGSVDIILDGSSGGTLDVTYSVVSRTSVVDYDFIAADLGPDELSGVQVWEVEFEDGTFTSAELVFHYDDTGMTEEEEQGLFVYHRVGGEWIAEPTIVDTLANTMTVFTDSFSPFLSAGVAGTAPLPTPVAPIPEPATALLLGAGLGALALRRPGGVRCRDTRSPPSS